VEDVALDELDGELGDAESTADPGEEAVDQVDKGTRWPKFVRRQ